MSDAKKPPDDEARNSKFAEVLRNFFEELGIPLSDEAIEELIKGNTITSTPLPPATPWPWITVREEKDFKDGKLEEIKPEETEDDD